MKITGATASIPVPDLQTAIEWYRKFLGDVPSRQPLPHLYEFEIVPGFNFQLIQETTLKAGDFPIKLEVDHLEAFRDRLLAEGTRVSEIQDIPGVIRMARLRDPFGNLLNLYEVIRK